MEAPHELPPDLGDAQLFVRTILEHDLDFMRSQTFREQCARAGCACRLNRDPPIPLRLIASVLGVTHGTLASHWRTFAKRGNEIGDHGRPTILQPEVIDALIDAIVTSYQRGRPLSLPEIRPILWTR
jgi:hypothetical protein